MSIKLPSPSRRCVHLAGRRHLIHAQRVRQWLASGAITLAAMMGCADETDPTGSSTASNSDASGSHDSSATGIACTWRGTTNECGAGRYCVSTDCATGVCQPLPTSESPERAPVCGCDAVNYYNASIAAAHGMSVAQVGECAEPLLCGGVAGLACPDQITCSGQQDMDTACSPDFQSPCWGLPKQCPETKDNLVHPCGQAECIDECQAMKSGSAWYVDDAVCKL